MRLSKFLIFPIFGLTIFTEDLPRKQSLLTAAFNIALLFGWKSFVHIKTLRPSSFRKPPLKDKWLFYIAKSRLFQISCGAG